MAAKGFSDLGGLQIGLHWGHYLGGILRTRLSFVLHPPSAKTSNDSLSAIRRRPCETAEPRPVVGTPAHAAAVGGGSALWSLEDATLRKARRLVEADDDD